ncbi:MAG: hypothetical protein Q7R30_24510 [Acidobacteriota bacterium]|nr:hypothetical protein [Acidobacteriota bacterium]
MTVYRRFTISLAAACALVLWLGSPAGLARAPQAGVHLTPSGYRVPVYGMSRVKAADGSFSNECVRLNDPQIESLRFGRSVSRAMARWSPQATVQAVGDPVKATFKILYTDAAGAGFNDARDGAARKRALEASVAAWSKVLQGTVEIVIQARMEAPKDGKSQMLASAGPVDLVGLENIGVATALASQMLDLDVRNELGNEADIEIVFSPDIDWDYSVNGAAARDRASFVYVTIHEIAHGLGFIDSFVSETGELLNPIPFSYDVFVNRGSGRANKVTDHAAEERKRDLISRDLFFSGPKSIEASKKSIRPGPMVKLYAPDPYESGSSIAHVDQETYSDFKTGLMTPRDFGSGTDKIDILTLGIMADMGYKLVAEAVTARVKQ